jgi:hypothetical protein
MNATRSVVAILLVTATAHAGNDELSIGVSNRALLTSSANAVTGDGLVGGALTYSRRLGLQLGDDLALWIDGRFIWGAVDGTMFDSMASELDTLALVAGARVSYPFMRHVPRLSETPLVQNIGLTGRIGVGTARAALAIRDYNGGEARDAGLGATSEVALGLELSAPTKPTFSLGLRLEAGVTIAEAIPLQAEMEQGGAQIIVLDADAAPLGALDLTGPFVLLSALGQF